MEAPNWIRNLAGKGNEDNKKDYPLNCLNDVGDGFSGWFAISNPRKCNDFCYWNLPPDNNSNSSNSTSSSGRSYAAWNTADPHHSTVIDTPVGTAYWTCIYDSADDKDLLSKVTEQRWVDSWEKHWPHNHNDPKPSQDVNNNIPFPYLRCQKGAGEHLKTWSGDVVKSAVFWETWIVLASLIYVGEIVALVYLCRRGKFRLRYERIGLRSSQGAVDGDADDDNTSQRSSLQIEEINSEGEILSAENQNESSSFFRRLSYKRPTVTDGHVVTPRCKYCTPITSALCKNPRRTQQMIHILKILLLIALNLLLAFTITFSSISLMEIRRNPHFKESMQKLTPACADPALVCPAGNNDIDRKSSSWPTNEENDATRISSEKSLSDTDTTQQTNNEQSMKPFSYLMASDAQLYWFNGEFPEMGKEPLPTACSQSDSCGRCTGKHGLSTNRRLQKAWEGLMSGNTTGMNASAVGDLPIPNTLIMNGKLT